MFHPENFHFVFASIEGVDDSDKIRVSTDWLSYWLKFKALCHEHGSVIFDIDDTLVNDKEQGIPDMIKIYKLCLHLNFIVNIITARPETKTNRIATQEMLQRNGITKYEALYMMPSDITPTYQSISQYKYNARMDVAKRHHILANCGDMWSDHCKYPSIKVLNDRSSKECAICFLPGQKFPCLKLPASKSDD